MNHDPLCPGSMPWINERGTCCCEVIVVVRADEQRKVISRLETVVQYLHDNNCITWAYPDPECDCGIGSAARGEADHGLTVRPPLPMFDSLGNSIDRA